MRWLVLSHVGLKAEQQCGHFPASGILLLICWPGNSLSVPISIHAKAAFCNSLAGFMSRGCHAAHSCCAHTPNGNSTLTQHRWWQAVVPRIHAFSCISSLVLHRAIYHEAEVVQVAQLGNLQPRFVHIRRQNLLVRGTGLATGEGTF